jgi:putative transposase
MPRVPRVAPGGQIYHVFNRSAGRFEMFRREADYSAFERVMCEAHERHPTRILAYCLMPNHWHFVLWPRADGELSAFVRWMTHTHAMRWRVSHGTVGYGHLYGGRFKSFPIQRDGHFLSACRYVERNALTAGLVGRARDWQWGSLWARGREGAAAADVLSEWPVERPADWGSRVERPMSAKEVERFGMSLRRGRPLGSDDWAAGTAARLGLAHTLRSEGRPRKAGADTKGQDGAARAR